MRPNVLVIVGNQTVRARLATLLKRAGLQVRVATEGESGLEYVHHGPCQLVVADVRIASKNGIELIKSIQHDFPDMKFIAVSGSSLATSEDFCALVTRLGVERFFTMPLDEESLAASALELVDVKPHANYSARLAAV
jgi:DNA-binding NtrC family response regulator